MSTTIAQRLLAVREAEGLALRPFAERLAAGGFPISAATVAGYENGRTDKVPADFVAAVCRVFGASPAWIILGEGPIRQPSLDAAVARLEAVRAALEAPLPESHAPSAAQAPADDVQVRKGADVLIELVPALHALLPEGEGRRADAVRLVDHVATRLADAGILAPVDHGVWRSYVAGAALGDAGKLPETALAEILGNEAPVGEDLQGLLVALGVRLEDEGASYALAADCQGLAFLAADRAGDVRSACDAARGRAHCHRAMAEWAEALEWYGRAMESAERMGDWARYGRVLANVCWLRLDQGATADARRIADRLIAIGEERSSPSCVAYGHQSLGAVAQVAGRSVEGIWHQWKAAVTHPYRDASLRALFGAGTSLLEAGHVDAAEDAYHLAASGIKELSTRLLAMSALAYVAAVRGDGEEFDERRRRREAMGEDHISRRDLAQILYYEAKAQAILGRMDEARREFQDAILFAERHGFHREAILADEALALLRSGTNPWPPPEPIPTDARLEEVHAGLRQMVDAAAAGKGGAPGFLG